MSSPACFSLPCFVRKRTTCAPSSLISEKGFSFSLPLCVCVCVSMLFFASVLGREYAFYSW